MAIEIIIFQIILGILLFFIVNWIGKHSYSIGYMQISMFLKVEEAPAFNFLFRVLNPVVFLIIISATLYKLKFDKYVTNVYMVSVYYLTFRVLFNLLTNRALLMNWYRQSLYWILIISLSYFSYVEIISKKENILPDFSTIANELWIIILLFLFQIFNQIRVSQTKTIKRKENYLNNRFKYFNEKYGKIIDAKIDSEKLKSIAYAILIYESFNRPKLIRFIENIRFYLTKKNHTLGVMQVQTSKFINDEKSVKLGIKKLKKAHKRGLKKKKINFLSSEDKYENLSEWGVQSLIIKDYNPDDSYREEISSLADNIFNDFFSEPKSYLTPDYKGVESYFRNDSEE